VETSSTPGFTVRVLAGFGIKIIETNDTRVRLARVDIGHSRRCLEGIKGLPIKHFLGKVHNGRPVHMKPVNKNKHPVFTQRNFVSWHHFRVFARAKQPHVFEPDIVRISHRSLDDEKIRS
jgi:hypothetical protein